MDAGINLTNVIPCQVCSINYGKIKSIPDIVDVLRAIDSNSPNHIVSQMQIDANPKLFNVHGVD